MFSAKRIFILIEKKLEKNYINDPRPNAVVKLFPTAPRIFNTNKVYNTTCLSVMNTFYFYYIDHVIVTYVRGR